MSPISKILIQIIHIYQTLISPLIKPHCRFQISCSQYGIDAISKFGILKGIWMLLLRILQCHPYTSKCIKK